MRFLRCDWLALVALRHRLGLAVLALLCIPGGALAEYRLQPGDVLDVVVAGIPDYRPHVSVGIEGEIGVPLAGQIKVGGLTVADARARIAGELANKLYRQYANDGKEVSHLILGAEVLVTIAEYSPVYVNGDVSKPGAYPFRPGMTVRQAVALAGGFNPVRLPAMDPTMQAAELQSQYNSLMAEYNGQQALTWRLKNELGQGDGKANGGQADGPSPSTADPLVKGEAEQMAARKADRDSSRASLQDAIKKATLQLGLLAEKKAQDEAGIQADQADFKTVRDLFQKGLAQSSRLAEARRAALMSSQQLLQTMAEMSNLERQRDDYARQLEKIDSQARVDELSDLQKADLRIAEIKAALKGISDRLMLVGRMEHLADKRVDLSVHRKGADGPQRIAAAEDLELLPGDVVEVELPRETTPGLIASVTNVR